MRVVSSILITRSKFEELVDPLVDRCRKPVLQALEDSKFSPKDIDEVVRIVVECGWAKPVARMVPLAVLKG